MTRSFIDVLTALSNWLRARASLTSISNLPAISLEISRVVIGSEARRSA
ncbi:hypothetical protein HMPREF0185_02146 [Brevundimonas diminuta 470-4]|nr:hypothetical protein HMPREF0185_02146 [Brevundimonas diminuta 470-4]